jgi:cytoskeletal protein CcmA (bactofilin family)
MSDNRGVLILGADAVLKGDVTNSARVEVHGYLEGAVSAAEVVVHEGGKLFGRVHSDTADIRGQMQGDVRVQQLISIKSTGDVSGDVRYGRLAIEEGGELTARVRNVPPSIAGDLDMSVRKGRSVRVTLSDLNGVDPDDAPENLTFEVTNAKSGFVAMGDDLAIAVTRFTQADLENGKVHFTHDGSETSTAQFDATVTDASGASSGSPKTVLVAVQAS